MDSLDPIGRRTVVDEIVDRLVRLIIDDGFKPGDQLVSERELMAAGRRSLVLARGDQGTVCAGHPEIRRRRHFRRAAETRRSSRASGMDPYLNQSSVQQVIEARSVTEVTLAGRPRRATDDEIAEIGDCLETLETAQADRTTYDSDLAFTRQLRRLRHNDMLANMLGAFQHVLPHLMETTYTEANTDESMSLHRAIFAAIQAHDGAPARQAMAEHTSGGPLLAASERSGRPGQRICVLILDSTAKSPTSVICGCPPERSRTFAFERLR
ncbi:MAG: FCD domain-containing protein [Caldilineaceae bacterium]